MNLLDGMDLILAHRECIVNILDNSSLEVGHAHELPLGGATEQ
jgi:hypothetical protein